VTSSFGAATFAPDSRKVNARQSPAAACFTALVTGSDEEAEPAPGEPQETARAAFQALPPLPRDPPPGRVTASDSLGEPEAEPEQVTGAVTDADFTVAPLSCEGSFTSYTPFPGAAAAVTVSVPSGFTADEEPTGTALPDARASFSAAATFAACFPVPGRGAGAGARCAAGADLCPAAAAPPETDACASGTDTASDGTSSAADAAASNGIRDQVRISNPFNSGQGYTGNHPEPT